MYAVLTPPPPATERSTGNPTASAPRRPARARSLPEAKNRSRREPALGSPRQPLPGLLPDVRSEARLGSSPGRGAGRTAIQLARQIPAEEPSDWVLEGVVTLGLMALMIGLAFLA